jgi:hypothetical protein
MSPSGVGMIPLNALNMVVKENDVGGGAITLENAAGQWWYCDPNGNTGWGGPNAGTYQKVVKNAAGTVITVNPDQNGVAKVYKFAYDPSVPLW